MTLQLSQLVQLWGQPVQHEGRSPDLQVDL